MPANPTLTASFDEPSAAWLAEFEAQLDLQGRKWRRRRLWRRRAIQTGSLVLTAMAASIFGYPLIITMFTTDPAPPPDIWASTLQPERVADLLSVSLVLAMAAIPPAIPVWLIALAISAAWRWMRGRRGP